MQSPALLASVRADLTALSQGRARPPRSDDARRRRRARARLALSAARWLTLAAFVVLVLGLASPGGAAARAPLPACADNTDNDGDTRVDFPADPGCANATDASEADPARVPLCADGVDNDLDNKIDWPDDPQCNSASDNNETNANQPLRACSNSVDDDGDGKRDYSTVIGFPIDPGCNWAAENSEADSACSDGIDNDGDGKADYPNDPGCILVGSVLGINRNDETDFPQCNDGRDNDGDGKVDAEQDPDCRGSLAGASEAAVAPAPQCSDGIDNDGDGKADFPTDPGCAFSGDNDETDPLAPPQCADGRDNDGDGRIDLADPGCSSASDNDEASAVTVNTQGEPISGEPARLLTPFPIVRLRGSSDRRGVRISLLTVRAPRGATVTIYCSGKSCPRRRATIIAGAALVRARQFEKRMRGGTILRIYVTKPGFVGKYTRFRFRTNRIPMRADRCARTPGGAPRSCP
jgi:hypothetical protein